MIKRLMPLLWLAFMLSASSWAQTYILGPGDTLELAVTNLEEMNGTYKIDALGMLELPYVKSIKASGLSVDRLKETLVTFLSKDYLNNPQIALRLVEFRSRPITVIGAVNRPGPIQNRLEMDLLQVIAQAGGRTANASDDVVIIRKSTEGQYSSISINLKELLEGGKSHLNIPIFAGDTVNLQEKQPVIIYVSGEVGRPGELVFDENQRVTLLRAITKAGGFTEYARQTKVRIRREEQGSFKEIPCDVKAIRRGKAEDIVLQSNDIIIVP